MEQYQELVSVITRYKRNQLQVLGYDKGLEANQYDQLYDFMIANPEATFEDCMNLFFPPEKRKQFTNLLGRFRIRLVNALFLIDVKKTNYGSRNEAYYLGWKNLAAIKILLRFGAKVAGEQLIKQTLQHSISTENFIVSAQLYRIKLKLASATADLKSVNKYFNAFKKQYDLSFQLVRSEYLYCNLLAEVTDKKSIPRGFEEKALKAKIEIEEILKDHESDRIWAYYYPIAYKYFASKRDITSIVHLMDEAISRLSESKSISTETISSFYHVKMVNLAALGNYDEVLDLSEKAESYLANTNGINYFIGKEFLCLVLLYKGDYHQAFEVYSKVKKNRALNKISPFKRENWLLIEAFLQLLKLNGKIRTSTQLQLPRFSVAKFANAVIHNNKDKQGYNIAYQILQVLFLLESDKLEQAEDKIMALYKYGQRHLQDDPSTERSIYFINALVQIPRGGFYRKEVEKRAAIWFTKMKEVPAMQTTDPFEIEILPYQRMWEIGMETLST